MADLIRCSWCGTDPLYQRYHDVEWGVPCRNDTKLFEFLILEGAQAGLSWTTILRKRENYRQAFAQFDAAKVAAFTQRDIERCVANPGIVRNRLKINSAISNARCFLEVQAQFGSFSDYLWGYVDGTAIVNQWTEHAQIPASTDLSDRLSKELKRRGFSFFGSTICYAYLQAIGVVNDHITTCYRHTQCH